MQSRLRAPGGCPWDREQTHQTLKSYLIEEAYEVLDALERDDPRDLREELGDLLFQVLFHSDIAKESGRFDIADVVAGVHDKMVRRHPHVFAGVEAKDSQQVLKNWAQIKAEEKRSQASKAQLSTTSSAALDGIPPSLPALLEAYQLTRRAARVGFDWSTVEGIFEKLAEETLELREALEGSSRKRQGQEVGDILFVTVNLARFLGFDPEVILKASNSKFISRFKYMEQHASKSLQKLEDLSKEQLEALWELAKADPQVR